MIHVTQVSQSFQITTVNWYCWVPWIYHRITDSLLKNPIFSYSQNPFFLIWHLWFFVIWPRVLNKNLAVLIPRRQIVCQARMCSNCSAWLSNNRFSQYRRTRLVFFRHESHHNEDHIQQIAFLYCHNSVIRSLGLRLLQFVAPYCRFLMKFVSTSIKIYIHPLGLHAIAQPFYK